MGQVVRLGLRRWQDYQVKVLFMGGPLDGQYRLVSPVWRSWGFGLPEEIAVTGDSLGERTATYWLMWVIPGDPPQWAPRGDGQPRGGWTPVYVAGSPRKGGKLGVPAPVQPPFVSD